MRVIALVRCWLTEHREYRFCDPIKQTFGYRCAHCGRESAVICDYDEPRVTQHGDQMRHVVFNRRLVPTSKRIAPVWLRGVHQRRGA